MGHFECDNIEFCRGNQQRRKFSCLIIITYRLSCKTIITKAASKTSKQTTISILKDLKPYQNIVKIITYMIDIYHLIKIKKTLSVTWERFYKEQ